MHGETVKFTFVAYFETSPVSLLHVDGTLITEKLFLGLQAIIRSGGKR